MRHRSLVGAIAVIAIVILGVLLVAYFIRQGDLQQRDSDVEYRRSLYDSFPLYPGAIERETATYEIQGDSGGTGTYGLTVTYEMPDDITATQILDFYRNNLPDEWEPATDATCSALYGNQPELESLPTPPGGLAPTLVPTTVAPTGWKLAQTDTFTAFAPGGSPLEVVPGQGRLEGVSFSLLRRNGHLYVIADEPAFSCEPITT